MIHSDSPSKNDSKPVLGLLGGPGSGKSTVARLFAELGCGVIDADKLSHDAIQSDAVRSELVQWWGQGVLDQAGRVDRSAVGAIVFADKQALRKLEALLHPLVHAGRAKARSQFNVDPQVVAIIEDCPLLLESKLDKDCDALVFVDCPQPIRLQRLQQTRGWDAAELKKREQHQLPLDTKRQAADYVIQNGVPLAQVREQVEQVLKQAADS